MTLRLPWGAPLHLLWFVPFVSVALRLASQGLCSS
jgi:hypothetical protein